MISTVGVVMDADKVEVVCAGPTLRTIRAVRGFLGLTGYYQKPIHSYGDITALLTPLLKRDSLHRSPEAAIAFDELKSALTSALILSCRISPSPSASTMMCWALTSAQCFTKVQGHWHSLAVPLRHTMPSTWRMSRSSSASSKPCDTGGPISGLGRLSYGPITSASNISWTRGSRLFPSILG
jgi:hypothetical protein